MVRIGLIGLGMIARRAHLPGFAAVTGGRLEAVATRRPDRAQKIVQEFGVSKIFADWKELLYSSHVDAVAICTPNALHAAMIMEALKAGKHVFVEKPAVVSREEAQAVHRLWKKSKRILMVHQSMRFDPAVRAAADLLKSGKIGKVFALRGSLTHRGPLAWSENAEWFFDKKLSGGGVLLDLGVHVFDALNYLLDDPIEAITAQTPRKAGGKLETHAVCLLKTRSGASGSIHVGWEDTTYQNRYYFFGEKGTLSLNLSRGEPIAVEQRGKKTGREYPKLPSWAFRPTSFQHFVDCVRTGKKPQVDFQEARRALEVCWAAYASLKKKQWEKVTVVS